MKTKHVQEVPLRRKLGVVMVESYTKAYEKSQRYFATYDLTSQQYNVLSILHKAGRPMSTSDILEQMIEKNAGVSRLVDRLINKNLVVKEVNAVDKRLIDISLTTKGEQLYQEVALHLSTVDLVYSALTDAEVETLISLLLKIKED